MKCRNCDGHRLLLPNLKAVNMVRRRLATISRIHGRASSLWLLPVQVDFGLARWSWSYRLLGCLLLAVDDINTSFWLPPKLKIEQHKEQS